MKQIRILQVFGALNRGGSESMIMNLYRAVDRSEIQFDFVKHTSAHCAFENEIESLGGKVYSAPKFKFYNYFSYKRWWNAFFKGHPEYKIVHGHLFTIASIFFDVAHKYNCVTIGHSHSAKVPLKSLKSILRKPFLLALPKTSDYCFACSHDAGKWIYKNRPYVVINNAIDVDKFRYSDDCRRRIREEFGLQGKFVVGNIGRLTMQKNQEFLIDVFVEVYKRNRDAALLIVGTGELERTLKEKVAKLGLSDVVVFTGSRPDVPALLSSMDVFVFPSLWEGLPVTVIEAQAAGLPVVCSNSITKEVVVTNFVVSLPLNCGVEMWSSTVLQKNRMDVKDDIKKKIIDAGYGVKENAVMLSRFYRRALEELAEKKR